MNDASPDNSALPGMTIAFKPPTLSLDVALYERYLDDRGLDADGRRQVLEALWKIIVGFVDLGFRVEPTAEQNPEKPRDGLAAKFVNADPAMIASSPAPPDQFSGKTVGRASDADGP